MGRGLGTAQKRALELLIEANERNCGIFVVVLAERLGLTHRRTTQIVDALRERGLVWTEIRGWHDGLGEKGRLVSYTERWPWVPVTAETPGARHVDWKGVEVDPAHGAGYWKTPGGVPGRSMIVFLGDPPETIFGPRDRRGQIIRH